MVKSIFNTIRLDLIMIIKECPTSKKKKKKKKKQYGKEEIQKFSFILIRMINFFLSHIELASIDE